MSQETPPIYSGGTALGSTTMPNIIDAIAACYSSHAGNAEPAYKEEGLPWWDADDDSYQVYDGAAWRVIPTDLDDYVPSADDSIDLGSAAKRFAEVHAALAVADAMQSDDITDKAGTGAPGFSEGLTTAKDIIPDVDSASDLGSAAKAWALAYLDQMQADLLTNLAGAGPPDATYGIEFSGLAATNAKAAHGKVGFTDPCVWVRNDAGYAPFLCWILRASHIANASDDGPPDATYGLDLSTAAPGLPAAGHARLSYDGGVVHIQDSSAWENFKCNALLAVSALKSDLIGNLAYTGPPALTFGAVFTPKAASGAPVEGEQYYDSAANKMKFWNGAAWETITSA
ncbi:MAG: hypothetical protein KAY24_01140 [Candidatus Eisenbacteria sp.]|nr:hypothetical protein [Candidatus Eisenbacteria bacterium]